MTVETALYPAQFNTEWPLSSDFVSEGDNHIRLTKTVLKTTFPNVAGAVTASHTEINYLVGLDAPLAANLETKGAIAGQTWTGKHVFPSTTTVGPLTPTIQAYLATVTSDVQAQLNNKGNRTGQVWTGTHDFSGAVVTVPSVAVGDSSNKPATTAFVAATALSASLPGQTGNAGKYLTTDGTNAGWAALDLSAYATKNNPTLSGDVNVTGRTRGSKIATGPTIDCSLGNYYATTVSGNTSFVFANPPAGVGYFVLEILHSAGTIAWPGNVRWPNNAAPNLTAGRTHLICFLTGDSGGVWRANALANYTG